MIKPAPKNMDGALLTESINTDKALIYTDFQGKESVFFEREGKLLFAFCKNDVMPVDTICIAKISEIKEDINAAFLLLGDKQKCFIHTDELSKAANLSRENSGFKCGDNVLIRISKEPSKGKLASAKAVSDEKLIAEAKTRTDFSVLRGGEDYIGKSLRMAEEISKSYGDSGKIRVLTDNPQTFDILSESISGFASASTIAAGMEVVFSASEILFTTPKLYQDSLVSLKVLYGIESKLKEALGRKVWLRSGAYITVEPTEAMTVIDVNTAKSSARKSEEDHYLAVNAEAADEIMRQILLRNLSGIIIIDYINVKNDADRKEIIQIMSNHPLNYEKNMNISGFTKLGLLEISRRKTGRSLTEIFSL